MLRFSLDVLLGEKEARCREALHEGDSPVFSDLCPTCLRDLLREVYVRGQVEMRTRCSDLVGDLYDPGPGETQYEEGWRDGLHEAEWQISTLEENLP